MRNAMVIMLFWLGPFFRRLLVVSIVGAELISTAYAEAWVGVGDGWYVDVDQTRRKGDIAVIFVRDAKGNMEFVEFDCKKRKILSPESVAKVEKFNDDSILGQMYSKACKSWYKFWQ